MTPQVRLKLIRDHMRFGQKYSSNKLYAIYTEIMDCDGLIEHRKVSYKTLRDQLRKAANCDSWLSQEGGLYFKSEPKCIFKEWHDKFIGLINWGKKWIKRP